LANRSQGSSSVSRALLLGRAQSCIVAIAAPQVNPPSNFFRSMAEREGRSENFAVEFKVSLA